jgi:hypothetical protein
MPCHLKVGGFNNPKPEDLGYGRFETPGIYLTFLYPWKRSGIWIRRA